MVTSPRGDAFAPFWQMPTTMLAGSAAAGGIVLINSFGNLSGFVGPYLVGWLRDVTGTTATGLYAVAGLEILCAVLILLCIPRATSSQPATPVRNEAIPS
jgi:MFS transporter, ACS family, tartrate transporter